MGHILISDKNGIRTLTLNRPDVRNAFDAEVISEMTNAAKEAAQDSSLRGLVVRGEGKVFCAGADLASMKSMINFSREENLNDSQKLYGLFEALQNFPGPVIGVAHGAAFGGALGLLAVCDYVIADTATQFCFSEVKLGISPAVISAFILKKISLGLIGPYMNLGLIFDSEVALRVGLVHSVKKSEDIQAQLETVLTQVRSNGPSAMKQTKALLRNMPLLSEDAAKKQSTELIASLRVSDEGQEGLRSFLEKRNPSWRPT